MKHGVNFFNLSCKHESLWLTTKVHRSLAVYWCCLLSIVWPWAVGDGEAVFSLRSRLPPEPLWLPSRQNGWQRRPREASSELTHPCLMRTADKLLSPSWITRGRFQGHLSLYHVPDTLNPALPVRRVSTRSSADLSDAVMSSQDVRSSGCACSHPCHQDIIFYYYYSPCIVTFYVVDFSFSNALPFLHPTAQAGQEPATGMSISYIIECFLYISSKRIKHYNNPTCSLSFG